MIATIRKIFNDLPSVFRIGLARALYLDADVVLLDDPLSAVDSKVGRHIFYSAVQNLCVKKGKCVVLGKKKILSNWCCHSTVEHNSSF